MPKVIAPSTQIKLNKKGLAHFKTGHPWLAATDVENKSALPERPSLVSVGGRLWFCSPKSFLRLRRVGLDENFPERPKAAITNAAQAAQLLAPWLRPHIANTLKNKIEALQLDIQKEDLCLRWIFSENDLLPGLIIDVFGTNLVAQINSAPMDWIWMHIKDMFVNAFEEFTHTKSQLTELRNSPTRAKEDLPIIPLEESQTVEAKLKWNGFVWHFHPGGKQKTGAYLDQRENHSHTALLAKKMNLKTAWDLCSYEGGFTLHLLNAGLNVTAVDQSRTALDALEKNVAANDLANKNLKVAHTDVFDFFTEQKEKVDLIVLDPPSFVKNPKELVAATKGYEELNTLCLKHLNKGGLLVSCVCSHHMNKELYAEVLKNSAKKASRQIEIIEIHGPSSDHAPLKNFSEGNYLHAWYVKALD